MERELHYFFCEKESSVIAIIIKTYRYKTCKKKHKLSFHNSCFLSKI